MTTATHKSTIRFSDLPSDYAGLCGVLLPRPIRTKANYSAIVQVADAMAVHESDFSRDQEDYFDLMCRLLETWDQESDKMAGRGTGENSSVSARRACAVRGGPFPSAWRISKAGPMILRGERSITAEHARVLGKHFALPAGLFIE